MSAPALPANWVATNPIPGNGIMFTTTVSNPSSAPNCLFLSDQGGISDKVIDTPSLVISSATAQLSFSNNWDMESSDQDYDGCVLEVSINGGAFVDILRRWRVVCEQRLQRHHLH